ncbi:hypothetical protein DKY63_28400 [Pseudomonas putida]|uniref:Uncharacterized protein n=1 Tax=Pseudomonas putida TaxID=303 RepID=A0A2Z4RR65_PSEPU|nr:hypothetical protein [Pseudomonas putida]AWY43631.1 hypothetical protein DKY63_28400 [Pseudomonas putida]
MMSEQEVCIARALNQLWRNQIAICETLHVLAPWMAETGHVERSDAVMKAVGHLMNSDRVMEPALRRLVELSGASFKPANDE